MVLRSYHFSMNRPCSYILVINFIPFYWRRDRVFFLLLIRRCWFHLLFLYVLDLFMSCFYLNFNNWIFINISAYLPILTVSYFERILVSTVKYIFPGVILIKKNFHFLKINHLIFRINTTVIWYKTTYSI